MRPTLLFTALMLATAPAAAQTLTPEDLRARIDARVDETGPYRDMLNDPDPARARAAMEIMIATGDTALMRLAAEAGFLAADPAMQRLAAEAVLATGLPLTIAIDGSEVEDKAALDKAVSTYLKGATTPEGIAFVQVQYGDWLPESGCYAIPGKSACLVSVNADGIYVQGAYLQARLGYGAEGMLSGAASVQTYPKSLPATLRLLE